MPIRINPPAATLALLAASAVALAACTGSAKPDDAAGPSPSTARGGLPDGVVNATAVPSAVPNDSAARKNVTLAACKATADGWQASGTARNPGQQQAEYTVTVFFTTSGGTVIGTGQSDVTVKAGGEEPWTISSTFRAPPDTRCVLRGVG